MGYSQINTYMQQAKDKREKDINDLMSKCEVFWAFSDKQFKEGLAKCTKEPGEKLILVSLGGGGYLPKKNENQYIAGMETIRNEFDTAMQDQQKRKDYILYELYNHEAFYTRSVRSTLEALGDDFTKEEIIAVFNTECNKKNQ